MKKLKLQKFNVYRNDLKTKPEKIAFISAFEMKCS
jgi:hypothetical protein